MACLVQFSSVRNHEGLAGSVIPGCSESQVCPLILFFVVNFLPNCVYSGDNLRSRPKKERPREREKGALACLSLALVLSCTHYYQAPGTQATVGLLKPALLEEDCLITTFSENKRFSIFTLLFFLFVCKRTNKILGSTMQPLKSLSLILLVRLQKTFVFRKRCDWTILILRSVPV